MTTISILEAVNTTAVRFHGQPIITAMVADVAYVAMRPIVENIGIDWAGQTVKLRNQKEKFNCCDISMVATDKKKRDFLCIPLRKLNGWLFSINPERVRTDIKDKLVQYQEECFSVLHEYWTKGEVKSKTTTDDRTPLRDAINMLVGKKGIMYPEAYSFIHQRFNVEHIDELAVDQLPMAVEYVHRLVLEGEFLGKQEALPAPALTLNYGMDFFEKYQWIIGNAAKVPFSRYPIKLLSCESDYPNPCGTLLVELQSAGHQVEAAMFQLKALQHHLHVCRMKISTAALTLQ